MKTTLKKAIGANSTMSVDEIKAKWDAASEDVKSQAPSFSSTIVTTQNVTAAAQDANNAIITAKQAFDDMLVLLNPLLGPANAALKLAQSAAQEAINKLSDSRTELMSALDNTEVEV